jgi:hypothetical protein
MKLAERLAAARGGPIDWRGESVLMMHEMGQLGEGNRLELDLVHVTDARPQALRVKVRGGRVSIGDGTFDDVVVWSDTAPSKVTLTIHSESKRSCRLRIWNAWRDPDGAMQAWIGNAGLKVEPQGEDRLVLSCSDGFGEVDFTDLVVAIQVTK